MVPLANQPWTSHWMGRSLHLLNRPTTRSCQSCVSLRRRLAARWLAARCRNRLPRAISLPFREAGGSLQVTIPANQNLAPIGYYILFAMVDDIPSVGVIVRIVPGGTADTPTRDVPKSALAVRVQPNPSVSDSRISWYQEGAGAGRVSVFDVGGRTVFSTTRHDGSGWHVLDWNARGALDRRLAPGVFLVEVRGSSSRSTARFVRMGQ